MSLSPCIECVDRCKFNWCVEWKAWFDGDDTPPDEVRKRAIQDKVREILNTDKHLYARELDALERMRGGKANDKQAQGLDTIYKRVMM